jgi:hypothetical protein
LTYGNFTSESADPNRVEWISQLDAAFANVKEEQRNATGHDRQQVLPVNFQGISLATFLDQHVLAGKNQPEGAQHGIENALSDVTEEQHELHLKVQGQVFEWHWKMSTILTGISIKYLALTI